VIVKVLVEEGGSRLDVKDRWVFTLCVCGRALGLLVRLASDVSSSSQLRPFIQTTTTRDLPQVGPHPDRRGAPRGGHAGV
jgi:hypothetical protein